MAIKISSDLVMDVMRAADPQRLATARSRLGGNHTEIAKLEGAKAAVSPDAAKVSAKEHKAHQQFEAAMLRTFTEQMMPKEASSFYGEGTAANIWRSVQVDLMSQNLAKAGGIGIADMLDKSSATRSKTAETLALNEIGGATSSEVQIATASDWPYFQRAGSAE